jgi:hypothetical protein
MSRGRMGDTKEQMFAGIRAYLRVARHLNDRAFAYARKSNAPAAEHYFQGLTLLIRRYNLLWGQFPPLGWKRRRNAQSTH